MLFRKTIFICLVMCISFYSFESVGASNTKAISEEAQSYRRSAMILIEKEVETWTKKESIIAALHEQNKRTSDMTSSEIMSLDRMWRSELKKTHKNLINRVLEHAISDDLRDIVAQSNGLYTEIVLLDMQGLAIAMTAIKSQYSYTDKIFWQKTFEQNSFSPYVGDIEFNDDTMLFQAPVAVPVMSDEKIIGLIYVALDVEILQIGD